MNERAHSVETQIQRRNIARRLFDEDDVVEVGRFTILERLGMGAMGAVYRAYDPSLDRAVALKVLHPNMMATGVQAGPTMWQEAQALARLAHPNVVTVHEVGGKDRRIWIAMELVDGGSLAEHLAAVNEATRLDTVVDAMLQAGEGLHAAHGAGVVHRDFKPGNVLVGTDGRVRVADFGLARRTDARESEPDTTTSVAVGTPAYMAPEQWSEEVDGRADQYAYCVVFWEALFGARPDPADLRSPRDADPRAMALVSVLRRGLREDPGDRYPSMHELLDAIRDVAFDRPRRRRRRVTVVAVAGGVIGAVSVAAWMSSGSAADLCSGSEQRLEALWPEADRTSRLSELAMDAPYAERAVPRIREASEAFSQAWADAYRTTCLAHVRKEQSDYVFERRMSCLDRVGASYAAVADRASSDDVDVSALVRAVTGLPRPQGCTVLVPLPEDARPAAPIQAELDAGDTLLARARAYLDAGGALRALELTDEAVARARALELRSATARALHERGRISTLVGPLADLTTEQATEDLRDATQLALLERDYALAVEAWSRRAWLDGTHGAAPAPLLAQAEVMIAMVRGAAPSSAEEALLHNNIGGLHLVRSDREQARASFGRSVEISASLPYPPRELDNASINLALVTDDNGSRDSLFQRIIAERRTLLGAEHPHVVQIELLFAVTTPSTPASEDTLERIVERYRRYHPELVKPRFEAHQELAWSKMARGRREEAAQHFEAARLVNDWDPLARSVAAGFASLAEGDVSAARSALETVSSTTTTNPWQRDSIAHARLGLAIADDSFEQLRSAAAIFADLEHLPTAALARRLELAGRALAPTAPDGSDLANLERAVSRWRAGDGDRAQIVALLRAL